MLQDRHPCRQNGTTVAWLLLVLLAWSQASLAAHQFDHSIAEIDETCVVCLKFERDDDVIADAGGASVLSAASFAVVVEAVAAVRAEGFSHYRSRASP